ncbi:MAG: carbohydrate ABC transporter permease, partial [Rhizobiales bacterium]|nr:carbohydrate ABC transporter permease [Hyphomicrobiales bacterium]
DAFARRGALLLAALPAVLVATAAVGFHYTTTNPFNPLQLQNPATWQPQVWNIAGYYAALLPFFFLLKTIGLLNTHAGLILVNGLLNIPVAFWLLAPFLRRVPVEIEEAAALDGAGRLRTLVSIVAPMIAPGIAATSLIVVILSFNEFLLASGLTLSDSMRTLTVGISLFQGDRLVNFGQMAAASLAGIVPIYAIALLMQKHLVEGLAHGGVK